MSAPALDDLAKRGRAARRPVPARCALILLALAGALQIPATADAETLIGNVYPGALTYPEKRPHNLHVDGPTASMADSIWLQRVHWSSWGGQSARATARIRYRTYEPWRSVRVRAYRARRCFVPASPATNNYSLRFPLYTRVRVSGASWAHTSKAPACGHVIVT